MSQKVQNCINKQQLQNKYQVILQQHVVLQNASQGFAKNCDLSEPE